MTHARVEPPPARNRGAGANVNIFGGLAVANLLASVLTWVGYARTGDPGAGVPAGAVTLLCVIFGVAHFHERIKALEQTVRQLQTAQGASTCLE